MSDPRQNQRAMRLIRRAAVIRPLDFEARGIPRSQLYNLLRKGLVERWSRGVYVSADHQHTEKHGLVHVARRVPSAVVCLISALQFHEITTQIAFQNWIAIPEKARKPQLAYLPIRVVRFSGQAFTEGVQTHRIEGVDVRVYSLAKTVVDCFKYRHKIGLDIALEALREGWWARKFTMDEIHRSARACRMERVMRPYLESLVG